MRAVVDNPELAELHGVRSGTVTATSWAVGTSLAGLATILLAPGLSMSITDLSLLVVSAFAAAAIGRLTSTMWTFVGGILLGVLSSYLVGYLPSTNEIVSSLSSSMPFIVLFVVLAVTGQRNLTFERIKTSPEPKPLRLHYGAILGVLCVAATALLGPTLSNFNALVAGTGLVYVSILLSLVLVTGMAGQISLAQLSFVGIGAVLIAHLTSTMPWILAAVCACAITGLCGAVVSLAALKLRGLYLALSSLAFAVLMDSMVFPNSHVMGAYGQSLNVPAFSILGHHLSSAQSQLPLLAALAVLFALFITWLKRGKYGRFLNALKDGPAAASALGLNQLNTKLIVVFISCAMAGLAGCFYGSLQGQIAGTQFNYLLSLSALLILATYGMTSISGAVVGSIFYVILFLLLPKWISNGTLVQTIQPYAIALGILNLALHPEGVIAQQRESFRRLRTRWASRGAARSPVGSEAVFETELEINRHDAAGV